MTHRPLLAAVLGLLLVACGGGSGADSPDAAVGDGCASTQALCNGACIDVQWDRANCGGCGKVCEGALVCVAGRCSGSCPAGQTACDGRCVSLETDRRNCGACGKTCESGKVCSEGACTVTCSARLAECTIAEERFCADTKTDSSNCGKCGHSCPAGEVCNEGACESWCGIGLSECNGVCVDKKTDRVNCGSCGTLCGPGEVCSAGKCQFQCGPGLTNCGGFCRDLMVDPSHCGSCDTTPCAAGEVCSAGKCRVTCGAPLKDCGGICRDVTTDEDNCGACGKKCLGTEYCKAGTCTPLGTTCPTGTHLCGGACVSDLDPKTCGSSCTPCPTPANATATCSSTGCGFTCNSGYVLVGGACVAGPPRPISPLSTAVVSHLRPTLTWALPPGADGARVQICRDRACSTVVQTFDVAGTSGAPSSDLATTPTMVYFWRVFAKTGTTVATAPSAAWELVVRYQTPASGVNSSWGSMLDLDANGFADVAVGAPATNTVAIFNGSATSVPTTASKTLTGASASKLGASVASAGDVDGDGYPELIVGAPGAASAFVYAGGPSGVATTPTTTLVGASGSNFGASVAGLGDVNGDGYADVIVGAPGANSAFVYLGSASGLSTTAATSIVGASGSELGFSVSSAGDVNADGFADAVVGAPGAARAFVHLGSKAGIASTAATTLSGASGSRFGVSVSGAFDTTLDGYTDLVVGAPGVKTAFVYVGSSTGVSSTAKWALTGTPAGYGVSVSGIMDMDYEGYDDLAIGTEANLIWIHWSNASGPAQRPGWSVQYGAPTGMTDFGKVVAGGGYVDNDRFGDLLIGAPGSNQVLVLHGASSGTGTTRTLVGASGSGFGSALARLDPLRALLVRHG